MFEYWDLYDKNRNKLNKVVKRGDTLSDDEYHLVVNAWVKNKNNEFLITQRAAHKSHPLMWECTGGSALSCEDSIDAAIREVKEELGIEVDSKFSSFVGTTTRYYKGCPDILDVWIFESDATLEDIKIQEEEVNDVMWASVDEIKKLYKENKFEANAFFEQVLNSVNEDVYYIGFNANNAICNDSFFKGSITLYPTREKGNIYYSDKIIDDTSSKEFMDKYKKYIYKIAKEISNNNINTKFICFNKKISDLCKDMDDINIVTIDNFELTEFFNNKFKTREFVKDIVPVLDYYYLNEDDLNYDFIRNKLKSDKFVIQGETGAGGDSTYLINNENDMKLINKCSNYCVSKYLKHLPLNITLIISDEEILSLPISVQLILLTNNKFKYVGADFEYANNLSEDIVLKIREYSIMIGEKAKQKGYRGIIGIDYILCDGKIYFMEINPRFQSSTFLISLELNDKFSTSVAELHYLAITNKKLKDLKLNNINKSYINCNKLEEFKKLDNYSTILNGYFEDNISSNYRKVFDRSILLENDFEQ